MQHYKIHFEWVQYFVNFELYQIPETVSHVWSHTVWLCKPETFDNTHRNLYIELFYHAMFIFNVPVLDVEVSGTDGIIKMPVTLF